MPFFTEKYFIITYETFFEEYINLKIFFTEGVAELYLFKVSEVIYALSCTFALRLKVEYATEKFKNHQRFFS
jgi:hypothetical protein